MAKPFASSADLGEKKRTLELLADGVYALTAEGDPNIGAIEGEDFVVCFEALATPVAAQEWIDLLRQQTQIADARIKELETENDLLKRALAMLTRSLEDTLQVKAHG